MKKIRCKLVADPEGGLTVNLPTFAMTGPIRNESGGGKSVEVYVPDEYLDKDGDLDEAAIREMYKGQEKWDRAGVTRGVQVQE